MPELGDLAAVVALPAVVAGLLLLLTRRLPFGPGAGAALAVGLAVLSGMAALRGWRGWPPVSAVDRIAPAVALGTAVGVAGLTRGGWLPVRFLARLLTCGGALWFLLETWRQRQELSFALVAIGVHAVAGAVLWSLLEWRGGGAEESRRESWRCVALFLPAAALAVALGGTGSVVLALLAAPLAAACGAAWVCARSGLAPASLPGLVPVWVVAALALGVAGVAVSELPAVALPWLLAAPLPVILGHAVPFLRGGPASVILLTGELVLIALGLHLALGGELPTAG